MLKSFYIMNSYNVTKPSETKSSLKIALPQIIAVMIKNILTFSLGMIVGYPTVLIPRLSGNDPNEELHLNEEQISWIGSVAFISIPLGSLLSGFVTQPIGRRRSMQVLSIPLGASWLLFYFATQVWHVYVGLAMIGLGAGLVESPILTFVVEITTPSVRGMLTATATMSLSLGIVFQFLIGTFWTWRTTALVSIGPQFLVLCLFSLLPESPYWLVMREKLKDAHKSLAWYRGWAKEDDVKEEFETMCKNHDKKLQNDTEDQLPARTFFAAKLNHATMFLRKNFFWPLAVVCIVFFLSVFTGAWTLQTYAVAIFGTFNVPINKYHAMVLLGLAEFIGCVVTIFMVRFLGKRGMGFATLSSVAICNVAVGIYASTNGISRVLFEEEQFSAIPNGYNWIPLVFLLLLAFAGHCGLRALPWILMGEVFSHETRAVGCGVVCTFGYICGFTANKVFLSMVNVLTISGTYWLYGAIAVLGCIILHFVLPETEGKSLQEIIEHFNGTSKLSTKVKRDNVAV